MPHDPVAWVPDPFSQFARSRPVVCPINDLLWLHLSERDPNDAVGIIVQVRTSASAPSLAALLRPALGQGGIVVYGEYVLAAARFDQLLTVLLPLTRWAGFVSRASAAVQRLIAHQSLIGTTPDAHPPADWSAEDSALLRWLTAQVAAAHHLEMPPRTTQSFPVPSKIAELLAEAAANVHLQEDRPILAVRLNRPVEVAVRDSRRTVKVDAAENVFKLSCRDVLWAVIDTGIDRAHEAFSMPGNAAPRSRVVLSYDVPRAIAALRMAAQTFTSLLTDEQWREFVRAADVTSQPSEVRFNGLRDDHGTHIAGILGASALNARPEPGKPWPEDLEPGAIQGMCPDIELVDIRIFDTSGNADEFSVMIALGLVKWMNERLMVGTDVLGPGRKIDGVNLSLSVPFDVDDYACGWTPVCRLSDELVNAGVVVVVAAGNAGFVESQRRSKGAGFRLASITDPVNAEAVITVGATASLQPYRHGPLARSSKGPTADGRHKPDILAPGESGAMLPQ